LVFKNSSAKKLVAVSIVGFIYSGYYVLDEVMQSLAGTFEWSFLGLSTCAYGFVFFTVAMVLSHTINKNDKRV
jgi:hypothetical protein